MSQESKIIVGLSREQLKEVNFDPVNPENFIKQNKNFQSQTQQYPSYQQPQPQTQQDVFQTERSPSSQQIPNIQDNSSLKQQYPIQYNNFVGNQQSQQFANVSGSFYKQSEPQYLSTSSKFSYGGKQYQ